MILVQLMLVDPPRIFHLRRFREFGLFDHVEFHGKMHITQPLVTRLSPWFRNWAKKYYAFVFASSTDPSNPRLGGFWIRRHIDLVYIDKAFCDFELLLLTKIRFANVSQIAVDATLLNGTTGGTDWRCRRFVSVMDQLLSCFPNVENMVFMAPTRPNPPRNRYPGLRLVDEEEEECQKHLPCKDFAAFSVSRLLISINIFLSSITVTNFYHCGAIVTNVAHTHILLSRSPDAISGPLIRTRRLHERDNLRKSLVRGCPMKVILFQRQGMPAPTKNSEY